jgi:CheY-like chemotaxis protein
MQLMTFAGQQNDRGKVVSSVGELCRRTVQLCRRSFPQAIILGVTIESDGFVEAAPGALEQVISNVLLNARDALEGSGAAAPRVELIARNVSRFDERWVEILVSDNGPGVLPALGASIFDPFVTTKRGKGTGLGLATSQAIVQQLGGQMAHRPCDGGGAEFLILLPEASLPSEKPSAKPSASPAASAGTSVLLIDDEPAIRRVVEQGLGRRGFRVVSVDGEEQVREVLDAGEVFEFVLLDRSLQGHDGRKLVPLLRAGLPGVQVYLFTGEFVEDAEEVGVDGIVQKPVRIRELASLIQAALAPPE